MKTIGQFLKLMWNQLADDKAPKSVYQTIVIILPMAIGVIITLLMPYKTNIFLFIPISVCIGVGIVIIGAVIAQIVFLVYAFLGFVCEVILWIIRVWKLAKTSNEK